MKKQTPSEHDEQVTLLELLKLDERKYPELARIFAVPNMGSRHVNFAVKMRKEGLRAGVPDLVLPCARGGWFGMFIEMKRIGGSTSVEQRDWIEWLLAENYLAVVCKGADEARAKILEYMGWPSTKEGQ